MSRLADTNTGSTELFLASLRRTRGGPGSRLVRELERVERIEFARVLLEAAARRAAEVAGDAAAGREPGGGAAAAAGQAPPGGATCPTSASGAPTAGEPTSHEPGAVSGAAGATLPATTSFRAPPAPAIAAAPTAPTAPSAPSAPTAPSAPVSPPGGDGGAGRRGHVERVDDWFLRLATRPRWRARARAVLWLQLSRGADHEEFEFLAGLLDRPRATWPAASAIVARARLVHEGPALAHAHARALELEGAQAAAIEAYVTALDRPAGRTSARVFEALGRLHRASGRHARALLPVVAHCQSWPFTPVALAEALASAFAIGDTGAASTLARALVARSPRGGAACPDAATARPRWCEPRAVRAYARAARAAALPDDTLERAVAAAFAAGPHSAPPTADGRRPTGAARRDAGRVEAMGRPNGSPTQRTTPREVRP